MNPPCVSSNRMTIADRLAAALRALLQDPAARGQAQAALDHYELEQERERRYREIADQHPHL
jgi:hypothetical protein